jgi:hypothetical protein
MALLSLAYLMGRRLGEAEILGPIALFFELQSKSPSKQSLVMEHVRHVAGGMSDIPPLCTQWLFSRAQA